MTPCGEKVTLLVGRRPEVVCDLPAGHGATDGLTEHSGPVILDGLPTARFRWPVEAEGATL